MWINNVYHFWCLLQAHSSLPPYCRVNELFTTVKPKVPSSLPRYLPRVYRWKVYHLTLDCLASRVHRTQLFQYNPSRGCTDTPSTHNETLQCHLGKNLPGIKLQHTGYQSNPHETVAYNTQARSYTRDLRVTHWIPRACETLPNTHETVIISQHLIFNKKLTLHSQKKGRICV